MFHLSTEISTLRARHPDERTRDLLGRIAFRQYLRSGYVEPAVYAAIHFIGKWDAKFSADQPRVPAGSPEGGQWTADGSSTLPAEPIGPTYNWDENGFDQFVHRVSDINSFSKHALNRAMERGVSPRAILDAVTNPTKVVPRPDGTTRYFGKDAVVVLNPDGQTP